MTPGAPSPNDLWQTLPDEEGQGGVTWKQWGCDVDMQRIVAEERLAELEASFRLYDGAMRRGVKLWQKAHPDRATIWPDGAQLAAWLMERLDAVQGAARALLADAHAAYPMGFREGGLGPVGDLLNRLESALDAP